MRLKLIYQHCLRIELALLEILVQRRDRFAVNQSVALEIGERVVFDQLAVYPAVVEDDERIVRGHVHIEFATPESGFLCASQRSEGISRISSFFAVPESSVSHNTHLVFADAAFRRRCSRNHHHDAKQRHERFYYYLFFHWFLLILHANI